MTWAQGLEAQLDDLFVIESARKQGVGRTLLRNVIARAVQRGARRLTLHTNEANRAAQRLYALEGLRAQSQPRYPGTREVVWSSDLRAR